MPQSGAVVKLSAVRCDPESHRVGAVQGFRLRSPILKLHVETRVELLVVKPCNRNEGARIRKCRLIKDYLDYESSNLKTALP